MSEKTEIFKLFGIKMLHGWLVDKITSPQLLSTILNLTYNDITLMLVKLEESKSCT
jgi:hypothetical protein